MGNKRFTARPVILLADTVKRYHAVLYHMIKFRSCQKIKWIVFAILFTLLSALPSCAVIQISLTWSPNAESDLAGYRVFSRIAGEDYDYSEPAWQGTETSCTIDIFDEDTPNYFVARAFDTEGFESENSDEVCYGCPDDARNLSNANAGDASEDTGDYGCFIRGLSQ